MQRKHDRKRKQRPGSPPAAQRFTFTLAFSLVLFVIITVLALRQSPRPYPLAEPSGWQSFALPREQNAFLRLPLFSGTINDLFVVPNSSLVWAVGDNGLVLHSADGGVSWQRQLLRREAAAPQSAAPPIAAPPIAAPPPAAPPQLFAQALAADAPVEKSAPLPPSNVRILDTKELPPDSDAERKKNMLEQERQQYQQQPQQQSLPRDPLQQKVAPSQQQKQQEPPQQQEEPPQQQEEPAQQQEQPPQQQEQPAQQEERPQQLEEPPQQLEAPPTSLPQQPLADLNSVWFFDANIGVVVGDRGAIYRTEDGGTNWQLVSAPANWNIDNLMQSGAGRLYATLAAAVIYSTDQGASWSGAKVTRRIVETPVGWMGQSEPGNQLLPVPSLVGNRASLYQVSSEGEIVPIASGELSPQPIQHAVGRGGNGLGVGDQGVIVRWVEGRRVSEAASSPTDQSLRHVLFVSDARALAVGDNGVMIESVNAGQTWSLIPAATDQSLVALAAVGEDVLLAAGAAGTLLRSDDGGDSWNHVVASAAVLASDYAKRHPGQQLRRNGEQFEVAATGSDNWQALSYRRTPALWYWLACGYFALLALGIANRKREVTESAVQTVADILASDRPLRPGDPDPLEFGAIARGLSRFMRNPKTEPPLTVAITGAWGTGKSSLMNLLHHDLKSYGFTPVWFNAWHHQKGEQLLASLYANIRSQAVPGWFSWSRGVPVGLLFRLNLLFRRSRKNLLVTLLLILVFTAATVYLQLDSKADYQGWIGEKIVQMASAGDLDSLLVVLFGNLAPLLAALRALRAFGLNPASLMAVAGSENKAGNHMDPGARQRFAREFNDVSSCLELGRMVIFIDDLDRCRQENVVDILEAVNFLAVSGDCYIVIGMDEKWVRVCIEQQFAQMVEEGQSGKLFSENYLEKLINIKVPVPTLESDASSRLLAPEEPVAAESVPLQRLKQWGQLQWQRYRYLLWMLGIGAIGIVAGQLFYFLGERLGPEWPLQSEPQPEPITLQQWDNVSLQPLQLEGGEQGFILEFDHAASDSSESNGQRPASALQLRLQAQPGDLERGLRLGRLGNGGAGLELVLRNTPAAELADPAGKAVDQPGAGDKKKVELKLQQFDAGLPSRNSVAAYLLASAILLLLVAAILYYLLKRQTRIVSDSPVFREALNLWHPWIMLNRQTPRAIKRYLNRVRYIAMRYRHEDAAAVAPLWQRLFTPRAVVAEEVTMDENFIDEAQLVALSAIFSVDESWLGDAEKFDLLANGKLADLLAQKTSSPGRGSDADSGAWQALAEPLQDALQQHLDQYGAAFLEKDARRKFLKVVTATEFA